MKHSFHILHSIATYEIVQKHIADHRRYLWGCLRRADRKAHSPPVAADEILADAAAAVRIALADPGGRRRSRAGRLAVVEHGAQSVGAPHRNRLCLPWPRSRHAD